MTKVGSWERTCPLCGADNQCAVASGKDVATCWCREVNISQDVLDAVPDEAKNRVCVCPACATQQGESRAR